MNRKLSLFLICMLGIMLLVNTVSALTLTENFEDDAIESNPSASWYTFADDDWDCSFVNDSFYRSSNHSYEVNDTDTTGLGARFNWSADDYEILQFYFMIENSSHENIGLSIRHPTGLSVEVRINGSQPSAGDSAPEPYVMFSNYSTEGWNRTISNKTWWCLRFDFNYTDDTVRCRLYNNATVEQTASNDTWLTASPYEGDIDIVDTTGLYIWGNSGSFSQIWFDDFILYNEPASPTTYGNSGLTLEQYIPFIGLSILGLMLIVNFLRNPSMEAGLLVLLVVAIIIVIVAMNIMSIL